MERFTIQMMCPDRAPSPSWGSVLHGMLMETLPSPWPEKMHEEGPRPLSQWVEVKSPTRFIWHIGVLDDDLGEALEKALTPGKILSCVHLNAQMTIESVEIERLTPAAYMKPFFLSEEPCPGMYITFCTPTTHKSQRQYAIFPSVELIAKYLAIRFCAMAPDFALADPEALNQVIAHTRISRYRLESMRYSLEGAWLVGYTGRVELRFEGPDPLKRLAGILFSFASWSGVGIKTALGMGGCEVMPLKRKQGNGFSAQSEKECEPKDSFLSGSGKQNRFAQEE